MEGEGQRGSAGKGDDDAAEGDEKGRLAGAFQLLDIGLQARAEHQNNDAQLRDLAEKVAGSDKAQNARPQNQTADQRADHLRKIDLFGQHGKGFGNQKNDRHVENKLIGFHRKAAPCQRMSMPAARPTTGIVVRRRKKFRFLFSFASIAPASGKINTRQYI